MLFVFVKITKGKGGKFIIGTVCLIIPGLLDAEEATIVSTYVSVVSSCAVLTCVIGADGAPATSALRLLAIYSRFKRAVASLFVLKADESPPVQLLPRPRASTATSDGRAAVSAAQPEGKLAGRAQDG